MTSYLTQQRSLGFIVGCSVGLIGYISTQRLLWNTKASLSQHLPGSSQSPLLSPTETISEPELLFGPGARAFIARKWNETVDSATKPIIKALVDRDL